MHARLLKFCVLLSGCLAMSGGCVMSSRVMNEQLPQHQYSDAKGECVVLVHGLARSPRSLKKAERFLRQRGYHVLNFGYPSTKYPIEILSEQYLKPFIETYCPKQQPVHFLTHSMGGIVVRHYLKYVSPGRVGRVVMLAPPNQGSEVVDRQRNWKIFRWILGPAGQQLGTDDASLPAQMGAVDFELGVIAGDRSIELLHSWFILPGADDGKVSVERAKIPGMKDFLRLHHTHTFIMQSEMVLKQVEHFFKTGQFDKKEG